MSEVDENVVLDTIRDAARQLDRHRLTLVCAPEQAERVRALVAALPMRYMPGLITVKPLPGAPPDQLIVCTPPPFVPAFEPWPTRRYDPEVPLMRRYLELKRWGW